MFSKPGCCLLLLAVWLGACGVGEPPEPVQTDAGADTATRADGGSDVAQPGPPASLGLTEAVAPESPAAAKLSLVARVADADGRGVAGVQVGAAVSRGGGRVEPAAATTDGEGRAAFEWTLGVVPVPNALVLTGAGLLAEVGTSATLDTPYEPAPFGDVDAYMGANGLDGSTEDLAFSPDGVLNLGIPGGLLAMDGSGALSQVPLTGDPIGRALGIAYDRSGTLWIADSEAKALRKVGTDGVVSTVLAGDGADPLVQPNYVGVTPDDRVLLSDPCIGKLLLVEPGTGVVLDVLPFDRPAEGGPNGFAFEPPAAGQRLFVVTENTGLLCGHGDVQIDAPLASLFAVPVTEAGFGERETIVQGAGLFGDGVAFDAEGNLYVVLDQQEDFLLSESAVWVLPAGGKKLVRVLRTTDRVMANVAFGQGAFGETTLYVALLAVPPYTASDARGVERFELGLPGLPLLP